MRSIGLYRYHKEGVTFPYKILLNDNGISFEIYYPSLKTTEAVHIFYLGAWVPIL